MHQPRGIERAALFVQPIEDTPARGQAEHGQQENRGVKPARGHAHVVEREQQRAETVGHGTRGDARERGEGIAAEEKLLQQGVDKGDVERDEQEILPVDAHAAAQLCGDTGKVDPSAQQEVRSQDHGEHTQSQRQRAAQRPPPCGEQVAQLFPPLRRAEEVEQGDEQEQCDLQRRFDRVGRLHHAVQHAHPQRAQQRRADDPQRGSFHPASLLFPSCSSL